MSRHPLVIRLTAPVRRVSSRRVARGGESGWRRWLVPALILLVVALGALNVRATNQQAAHALDTASHGQAPAASAQDLDRALHADGAGVEGAQRSLQSDVARLRDDAPSDPDVNALGAATASLATPVRRFSALSGRGKQARRLRTQVIAPRLESLSSAAATVRDKTSRDAVDRQSVSRQRSSWTLAGGLALVLLLMWTFWAQRNSAESERRERRFEALLQNSSDMVLVTGRHGRLRYASPAVERMLSHRPEEVVGTKITDMVAPDDRSAVLEMLDQAARSTEATSAKWTALDAQGLEIDVESTCMNLLDDPVMGALVITVSDVGERNELEGRLRRQAFYDSLTELPNRALFEDRVRHAIAGSRRDGQRIAVLFVDLDDFKTVNDSLGHAAGDELLGKVGRRLHDCTRSADTAARLGGDEFGVLVEDLGADESADPVADRIHEALSQPFDVGGHELLVNASIGIATSDHSAGGEEILRNADIAMYAAKGDGKGHSETFRPSMHLAARKRLQVLSELRRAVSDGDFIIRYQPLVDLESGRMLGLEALVRWQHPTLGEVPPADFIPLAEETGLIIPIGRLVLREACRQAAGWENAAREKDLYVSVNLSPRQFRPAGQIVQDVREACADAGLEPSRLMLELTENVLMEDRDTISAELTKLKELGVRIAIDDFGTGYSALSSLREFPVDTVKMDRSFVRDLARGSGDAALVRTVVDLGEALDMEIVAEGIEMRHQLDSLNDLNCTVGQGFYFAKPLDLEGVADMLARENLRPSDAPAGTAS